MLTLNKILLAVNLILLRKPLPFVSQQQIQQHNYKNYIYDFEKIYNCSSAIQKRSLYNHSLLFSIYIAFGCMLIN